VCNCFEPLPQILENVRAQRMRLEQKDVIGAIDSARLRLGASGRLIVRASGTEPVIRVMGEGDDRSLVQTVVSDVCSALRGAAEAA